MTDKLVYKIYHCESGWYATMEPDEQRQEEYETDMYNSRSELFYDLADGRLGWCAPKRKENRK